MRKLVVEMASDDCVSVYEDDKPRYDHEELEPFTTTIQGVAVRVEYSDGWKVTLESVPEPSGGHPLCRDSQPFITEAVRVMFPNVNSDREDK